MNGVVRLPLNTGDDPPIIRIAEADPPQPARDEAEQIATRKEFLDRLFAGQEKRKASGGTRRPF